MKKNIHSVALNFTSFTEQQHIITLLQHIISFIQFKCFMGARNTYLEGFRTQTQNPNGFG